MSNERRDEAIRVLALVIAALMITSVMAPIAVATGSSGGETTPDLLSNVPSTNDEQLTEQPNTSTDRSSGSDRATVDDAVVDANGTVDVVVRVEELELPLATTASTETVVDELQTHAERSQQPVVDYARSTDGVELKQQFWLTNAVLLELDTEEVDVRELVAQKGVTNVHANFEVEVPEPVADVSSADYDTTYGLEQINATAVWDEYDTMGAGAKVAVLDTGVDASHQDIDLYTEDPDDPTYPGGWAEFDGDGNQVDSEPYDSAEHGTHTSGTVAGGNASGEYVGVAPEADLMHGKVLDGGSGSFAQIIAGMEWAVDENADVMSMSLGAEGYYAEMIEPVRNAEKAGTIVVSSSGNSGEGTSGSPANVYEAFAIGASNEDADIADFSSGERIETESDWGSDAPDEWPDEYVVPNVAAPGVNVKSTVPGGGYDDTFSGTSMAAPHASGAIALMLSASADEPDTELIKTSLEETAWKPDGEDDDQDVRYGHGIVDAKAATDRVAADSGVEGTVTDENGEPIEDATVVLGGVPRTTDENGTYFHRAAPGEYDVTVDAFGYEDVTTTVTVEEDNVTEKNVTLADAFDARVLDDQPESIESGQQFTVTAEVANLESATIEAGGDYEGDLSLEVDGTSATFGEPVEFDDPYTGELTVTVEASENATRNVELTHTLSGLGNETTVTTGPTYVVGEFTDVAVVDAPDGAYGAQLESYLERTVHPRFDVELIETDELLSAVDDEAYDVYVVQSFDGDDELAESFVEATDEPQTGVILLDQYGDASSAIADQSEAIGDPGTAGAASTFGAPDVTYTVETDHAILDGVAEEGETITVSRPAPVVFFGGFHSYFDDYEGIYDGTDLATVQTQGATAPSGTGLAADPFSRTVLASSLGISSFVDQSMLADDADQILANAVEYASDAPPVVPLEGQSEKVDPGESVTATVSVEDLEKVKVDVAEESTIDEDDLTLYVGDTINAFGEWRAYDPAKTGEYDIRVEVADDADAGTLSLDHTFVTGDGEETTLTTGPTAVYEGDTLDVDAGGDGDVETLTEAADIVEEGGEIVVEAGTYDENDTDYDGVGSAAVVVDTDGVTVRAAENASPTVNYDGDGTSGQVMMVEGDDVHVDGLTVNVDNGSADEPIFHGIEVRDGASGFSATDVKAGGVNGIFLDAGVSDVHVENVVGYDASTVVGTDWNGGPATNVTIENVSIGDAGSFMFDGVRMDNSQNVTISDSDLSGLAANTPGIHTDGTGDVTIANNDLAGVDADAIYVDWMSGESRIVNNSIDGADAAIWTSSILGYDLFVSDNDVANATSGLFVDSGPSVTATNNTFAAENGFAFDAYSGFDAGDIAALTYNDLSGSTVPFHALTDVTDGSYTDEPGAIDARLNFVGDRTGNESIAVVDGEVGNVVYQPFLTTTPDDLEATPGETSEIGVDLHLEGGETYAVGVPGPSETPISEMVDDDFEGAIYGFDAESQSWSMLTGNDTVASLNAMLVVAETDTRLTLDFQSPENVPPGPAQYSIEEGWNFVSAPVYGSADDAYGVGSFEPGLLMSMFEKPDGQLGPASGVEGTYVFGDDESPTVSAFEGYFVYSETDGTMPARIGADPTVDDLYDRLGVDDQFADADSENTSVEDVLERADQRDRDVVEATVSQVVYHDLEQALEESDDPRRALNETATAVLEDAPAEHRDLVETATEDALRQLFVERFVGGPIGEDAVVEAQRERLESDDPSPAVTVTAPIAG